MTIPDGLSRTAIQSFGLFLAMIVGALAWILTYDGVVFKFLGHTATMSHAMYYIGLANKWLPWTFMLGGFGLVIFLTWHFWGLAFIWTWKR